MEYDYYYADIQVTLTLKADNENTFGQLTDNEYFALQQALYQTLSCFQIVRALYMTEDGKRGGN